MWHLAIPIPNCTGFLLGYLAGVATIVAWGMWAVRRDKKRMVQMQEEAYDEAVRHQFGHN